MAIRQAEALVGSKRNLAELHGDKAEHIDADFLCSICQELLVEPCTGICGHQFCKLCLEAWRTAKQGEPGGAVCPECRGALFASSKQTLGVCRLLERMLQQQYPQQYQARLLEVQAARVRKEQESKQQVDFHTAAVRDMLLGSLAQVRNTRADHRASSGSMRHPLGHAIAAMQAPSAVHTVAAEAPAGTASPAADTEVAAAAVQGPVMHAMISGLAATIPSHSNSQTTNQVQPRRISVTPGVQQHTQQLVTSHPSAAPVAGQVVTLDRSSGQGTGAIQQHTSSCLLLNAPEYAGRSTSQVVSQAWQQNRQSGQAANSLAFELPHSFLAGTSLPMLAPPARVLNLATIQPSSPVHASQLAALQPGSPAHSGFSGLSSVFQGWTCHAPTGGGSVLGGGYALPTGFVQGPAMFGPHQRRRHARRPSSLQPVQPTRTLVRPLPIHTGQDDLQVHEGHEHYGVQGSRAATPSDIHVTHEVTAVTIAQSEGQAATECVHMQCAVYANQQHMGTQPGASTYPHMEADGAVSPSHSNQSGMSDPAEQALLTDEQNLGPEDGNLLEATDPNGCTTDAAEANPAMQLLQDSGDTNTAGLPGWMPGSILATAQPSCYGLQGNCSVMDAAPLMDHMTLQTLEAQFAAGHPTQGILVPGVHQRQILMALPGPQQAGRATDGLLHRQLQQRQQWHQSVFPQQRQQAAALPQTAILPQHQAPSMPDLQAQAATPQASSPLHGTHAAQSSIHAADVIIGNDDDHDSGDGGLMQYAVPLSYVLESHTMYAAGMDMSEGYGDSDDVVTEPANDVPGTAGDQAIHAATAADPGRSPAQLLLPVSIVRSQGQVPSDLGRNNGSRVTSEAHVCPQGARDECSSTRFPVCAEPSEAGAACTSRQATAYVLHPPRDTIAPSIRWEEQPQQACGQVQQQQQNTEGLQQKQQSERWQQQQNATMLQGSTADEPPGAAAAGHAHQCPLTPQLTVAALPGQLPSTHAAAAVGSSAAGGQVPLHVWASHVPAGPPGHYLPGIPAATMQPCTLQPSQAASSQGIAMRPSAGRAIEYTELPVAGVGLGAGHSTSQHASFVLTEHGNTPCAPGPEGSQYVGGALVPGLNSSTDGQSANAAQLQHAAQMGLTANHHSVLTDVSNTQHAPGPVHISTEHASALLAVPGAAVMDSWHRPEADMPMRLAAVEYIIQEVLANLPRGLRPERAAAFHGCVFKLEQALYTSAPDAVSYADRKTLMPRFLALRKQLLVAAGRRSTTTV